LSNQRQLKSTFNVDLAASTWRILQLHLWLKKPQGMNKDTDGYQQIFLGASPPAQNNIQNHPNKDLWKNDPSKITSEEHHNSPTSWKNLAALNIPEN
jgi:hypothetical protein